MGWDEYRKTVHQNQLDMGIIPAVTQVAEAQIGKQVPQRCGTETFDVGMDCVSAVCDDYVQKVPFPFTGTFESVTFTFGDYDEPSGMDRLELATKMD